ncbi:MAG: hypothetical protein QM500_20900 [Methylococcales bacterium]
MIKTKLFTIFTILIFSTYISAASSSEKLKITKISGTYELSVPVSRLIMDIPFTSLIIGETVGGATQSPRYFNFIDNSNNLIISGWFEPQHAFSGIQKFWKAEVKSWKQRGLPNPQNTLFTKIGNWDSIIYDITIPSGNNSHIRAHWLQAGTWIDIHLSITNSKKSEENRTKLKHILNKISIKVQSES